MGVTTKTLRVTLQRPKRSTRPAWLGVLFLTILFFLAILKFPIGMSAFQIVSLRPAESKLEPSTKAFVKGQVYANLHRQAISHHAFHAPSLKLELARLALRWPASDRTVVIVGVAHGAELIHFAKSGFRTIGFEPNPRHVSSIQSRVDRNPSWDAQIFQYAAGAQSGHIDFKYKKEALHAEVVRLDDVINEKIAVLSIDVQGAEHHVLDGAKRIHESDIAMIWFEVGGCNTQASNIFKTLDDNFVMFDFVPWGRLANRSMDVNPSKRENFLFYPDRPSDFEGYMKWLCKSKTSRFKFLQTDVMAVRRSLVSAVIEEINNLGDRFCNNKDARCVLRKLAF